MKPVTLTPPNASVFAAVQIDVPDPNGRDGRRIVGAAPAFRVEEDRDENGKVIRRLMLPVDRVEVHCHLEPGDSELRAVWAYEDSTIPNEHTAVSLDPAAVKVVGGLRVT